MNFWDTLKTFFGMNPPAPASFGFHNFMAAAHIDADGSPKAYGPGQLGEDYIANAGRPGNYWGIVCGSNGVPIIQGASDPAPGYYISTTSLQDANYAKEDPRRYVDSEVIPGCVLPESDLRGWGVKLGDLVLVSRPVLKLSVWTIFHDVGPARGEISIATANALKISADPKHGGMDGGIGYAVYPGSGLGRILTAGESADRAHALGLPSASAAA